MTVGGAWLAGLLLAFAPNGWWIDAGLAEADPAYRDLVPMDWLGDTPSSLWIVFHRRSEWWMAAYLPPDAEEMRWARAFPQVATQEFDRLLPRLDVPRLILRQDVYGGATPKDGADSRRGTWLVDFGSLAVDSSEILYNALLEAHVDLATRRGETWTEAFAVRGDEAMGRVPEAHRGEAFRHATVDFASHLLSLAAEIARQSRRHSPDALCGLLDPPRVLFRTWHQSLGDAQFPGRWRRPAESGSEEETADGGWVTTRDVLRPEDKEWVVREVLGAGWTGDPAVDFARFCTPSAR